MKLSKMMILTSNSIRRTFVQRGVVNIVARQKKEGAVKLTLNMNEDVIIRAKIFALENKRSLSDLVEELLREKLETAQTK